MLTPERLLRLMIELIFVLLGGLLMWLGLAGPAHCRLVSSQRGVDLVGLARAVQPGPVVVALAKLDTRVVSRTAGRPHARDFARAISLGWSDARGRGRTARVARHDCLLFDLPAAVSETGSLQLFEAFFF